MSRFGYNPQTSSSTEHAPFVRGREPSSARAQDSEAKVDNLAMLLEEESRRRRNEQDRELRDIMKMLMERHPPGGPRGQQQKIQDGQLGGRSQAMEPGGRREGVEASRSWRFNGRVRGREDLGAGHRSELMEGAAGRRPALNSGAGAAVDASNGESTRTILYPRFEERTRPSTSVDETGGSCRPYHLKIPPPVLKCSSSKYLSLELKFLKYVQRHDFARSLLEKTEIRLGDDS